MKIVLLNQFGGKTSAPTARILMEVGEYLSGQGHKVIFVSTNQPYGEPVRGLTRILREAKAHWILFYRSLLRGRADVVISLTSPACLPVTATFISWLLRAKHYHWAMDLYPDVAVRLNQMRVPGLAWILSLLMRWSYRFSHQVVALDDDMRDYMRREYGVVAKVVEPMAPDVTWPAATPTKNPTTWLYSGNFGQAHDLHTLLRVQRLLEEEGSPAQLVLQGHGPQFEASRDAAFRMGLKQVEWRAPVPFDELPQSLLDAGVLVVTRKPELKGILLPSKLILAELSGRSVLWIGDADGRTARRLTEAGRHGVFQAGKVVSIAKWLKKKFEGGFPAVPPYPVAPGREQVFRQWASIISG